jgi:hypothetical protein
MKKPVLLALLLLPALASAQSIPAGYIQATATVPILANGSFGAAWTNLSSSPQLGLLGCVSTFQTTVNGTIDSFGKFSVLLADPGQICPSPSTWTFTFSCYKPPGAFITPITVTGAGSVDDISAQIIAAAPANICQGGGSGGLNSFTSGPFNPFFTTSLGSDPTHNPALAFTAESNPTFTFPGNFTSGSAPWAAWTLAQGSNITLTPSGNTLTIAATGGSGGCTTSGGTNQPQGANGSGGCSAITTQVGGTNLLTPLLPNVVGAGSVAVTNPSTNEILITGTPVALQTAITPPVSGQYVVIYPTGVSTSGANNNCLAPVANLLSGYLIMQQHTGTFPPSACSITWTFTGALAAQAPWVIPANVTAVYAASVNAYATEPVTVSVGETETVSGVSLVPSVPAAAQQPWDLQQTTSGVTGLTGTTLGTATIVASLGQSGTASPYAATEFYVNTSALIVYYAGTASPVNSNVQVAPPLCYIAVSSTLCLDSNFPAALNATPISGLGAPGPNINKLQAVFDGASSSDCTTGGGSHFNLCQSTGAAWVIWGGGGGGGDTITSPGGTLTVGGTSTNTTLDLALGHANAWSALQGYSAGINLSGGSSPFELGGSAGTAGQCPISGGAGVTPSWGSCASAGVASIDTLTGAFTFSGAGVSHIGNAYTFSGTGSGVSLLNGLSGALSLTSTGSTVTITPSGSTIDLETSGSGSGAIASNATFVFTGTSINDDDHNALEPLVSVSSWSTSSSIVSFVNTGTNGFAAGDWVNARFLTGWPAVPSGMALGTGHTLFQVLSSGLSATTFQINVGSLTPGTCPSSCGSMATAMNNFPFLTTNRASFPTAALANTSVFVPAPVTIAGINSNYTAYLHPLSPAVTGTPAYLFINDHGNDDALCTSPASVQSSYQGVFAKAHTDGYIVVVGTGIVASFNQVTGCGTAWQYWLQNHQWLINQGKTSLNRSSGQYWDILVDTSSASPDGFNTNFLASSGGPGPSAVEGMANASASAIYTGGATPVNYKGWYWGAPSSQGTGASQANGYIFQPSADSEFSTLWLGASGTEIAAVNTTDNRFYVFNKEVIGNGNSDCPAGAMFCVGSGGYMRITSAGAAFLTDITDAGAAAGSGTNCLQIDTVGHITNTGATCTQDICTVTQALSTTSIAPGGLNTTTATCTGATVGDIPDCKYTVSAGGSGIVGYDVSANSGNVLTTDVPTVQSSNTITINQTSSLLNTLTFTPGAMSMKCRITR